MIRAILIVYVGVLAILACVLSDSPEMRGMAGVAVFGCGMACMYFVERHNRN